MKTTLLIMAAGLGSRYGGNKQIDHNGPHGEILLEYSIYDAMAAGFDKVVFVIKRSMADTFRELIGDKIAKKVEVEYAYQEYDSLPEGFVPPEGRTKPYGTVHAVLVAKDLIHEPFAVINADDYYGKDAFATMANSLKEMQGKTNVASMVAYRLKNTVSENGHVTRGVCARDDKNHLVKVQETYKIKPFPDGTIRDVNFREEGDILDPEALVSMNFWGLTPWFFGAAARDFAAFLRADNGDPMKKEFVLPTEIDALMHSRIANLFYAAYGRRDSQEQCGAGQHTNNRITGGTASRGMTDTIGYEEAHAINPNVTNSLVDNMVHQYAWYRGEDDYGGATVTQVNNICCLGYEDIYGHKYDMMDGVDLPNDSGNAGKWRIWMPDGTTRMVKGGTSSGVWITAVAHGKYMDVVPVGSVSGSSSTHYCDMYYISTAASRVVYRGNYNANPNGGVSMSNANNDSSNASTSIGSRLAFRGRLVKAATVAAFKSISEVA